MKFATDSDLVMLVPDIYEHNVESWEDSINRAEEDIIRKIRAEWYNKKYSRYDWDLAELQNDQWTQATLYRALAYYILPQLTQWRQDGDSFREQMSFYQARYEEEMDDQFKIGILYGYHGSPVDDIPDQNPNTQDRLWR